MGFEIRPDIKAALDTVDGVRGFERQPTGSRNVGDAWPRWAADTRVAAGVFETAWAIIVRVPDDAAAQETWIAEHRWPLVDALAHLIHVDSIAPEVLEDFPVLMIIGRE